MQLGKITFFCIITCFISTTCLAQNTELNKKIAQLDSLFFGAYNTCDTALQRTMYSDKIEFYHDNTGLDTSKNNIIASTGKYICGQVSRELVPGSMEIYPIHDYGAVAIGLHRFKSRSNNNEFSPPFKFIIFWKNTNGKWTIEKVVSLHIATEQ
jgi:hypothetical protein